MGIVNIFEHCKIHVSKFSGELILVSYYACSPGFHMFYDNGTIIKRVFDNNLAFFIRHVSTGDILKLGLIKKKTLRLSQGILKRLSNSVQVCFLLFA